MPSRLLLAAVALTSSAAIADTLLKRDGGTLGPINIVNCVGSGITCARSGATWTLSVDGGSGGTNYSSPLYNDGGSVGYLGAVYDGGPKFETPIYNDGGSVGCLAAGQSALGCTMYDTTDRRYLQTVNRTWGYATHTTTGSGFTMLGAIPTHSSVGTAGGPVDEPDSIYVSRICANAVNSVCGERTGTAVQFATFPRYGAKFKWPNDMDLSGIRFWMVMTTAIVDTVDSDSSESYVGLRWSASVDTNFQCCSANGVSESCSDTGVAPGSDVTYTSLLDFNSSGFFDVWLNGVLVCHKSTFLPAATAATPLARMNVSMAQKQNADGGRDLRIGYIFFDRN